MSDETWLCHNTEVEHAVMETLLVTEIAIFGSQKRVILLFEFTGILNLFI